MKLWTDGRTGDGRTNAGSWPSISSPCEPNGSGELKMVNLTPYQGFQDSFLHEPVKKLVFYYCNIRLCSAILWIRQFYLLAKNTKKTLQMPPNSTKISKFSPGEHAPGPSLAKLCAYRARLRTFHAQTMSRQYGFRCYPSSYSH